MNQQDKKTFAPERTDSEFISDTLKSILNARIGLVVVAFICLCLMGVVYVLATRPQRTVVIDQSSGRTYAVANLSGLSEAMLERQLTYYSVKACIDFYNFDYLSIEQARKNIVAIAHPKFLDSLPRGWVDKDPEIQRCKDGRYSSFFDWEIIPKVTLRSDPYYSTFCVFTRVVKIDDSNRDVKKYNVKLDWGRLDNNSDYTKRPHSLVLLRMQVLNQGSTEYNDQINQLHN